MRQKYAGNLYDDPKYHTRGFFSFVTLNVSGMRHTNTFSLSLSTHSAADTGWEGQVYAINVSRTNMLFIVKV
jgi:hypothetical protein